MLGSVETIPAEPGGGAWVMAARVGARVDALPGRMVPMLLFGVMLTDGGVVWSTDVERATTFLTRRRAVDVIGDARGRGDLVRMQPVRPMRLDDARPLARLSRAGALGEQ